MASEVIDVETDDFARAAAAAGSAGSTIRAARDAARASLAGLSRMAGSDPSGVKWASSYDSAAGDAFAGLDGLVLAFEQVAAGLAVTGVNYATADWLSSGHSGMAPGASVPSSPVGECTAPPPSASGGSRSFGVPGFDLVANFIGDLWPDGDTGELKSAGRAWKTLGAELESAAGRSTAILDSLSGSQTPEMDSIKSTVALVKSHASDLATQAAALGEACVSFASHVEQVHTDTERELQSLLLQVELTAAGGLILTVVTAGLSDAAAAAGAAAEVAASVSRILAFIARLASAALRIADDVYKAGSAFFKAASLSEKIGVRVAVFAGKSVKYGVGGAAGNVAVTAIVDPKANLVDAAVSGFVGGAAFGVLGEGAVVARAAVKDRSAARVLAQGFGHHENIEILPARVDHVRPDGEVVRTRDLVHPREDLLDAEWPSQEPLGAGLPESAKPVQDLLPEGFSLWNGGSRAEYDSLYSTGKLKWNGSPEVRPEAWPDPSLHPDGFASPESRLPAVLHPGATFDRFGGGFGRFTSPSGTAFPPRALPDYSLFEGYHRFEVLHPLPAWVGPAADAMGKTGGAPQIWTADSIDSLLEAGFIKEIF